MSGAGRVPYLVRFTGAMMAIAVAAACASAGGWGGQPPTAYTPKPKLAEATIEVWVDRANRCRTNTTPFFQVKKNGKAKWTIRGTPECDYEVEVRFDKGDTDPLIASCVRKNKNKIECEIDAAAGLHRYEYSVIIDGAVEDPEIEIVM